MKTLTNDQIVSIVTEYIKSDKKEQAILLDGEWGTGKTHFVKNEILTSSALTERKVIFVSLNGLKTVEEISRSIYDELNEADKIKSVEFLKKYFRTFKEYTKRLANERISMEFKDILYSIGKIIGKGNYVLFFDDFERCQIHVTELLGYINQFVEEHGVKVIIIANENEIGKANLYDNLEQKYQLVLSDKIEFPEKFQSGMEALHHLLSDNKEKSDTLTFVQLNRRIESLFSQNRVYLEIKEKVIGRTIKYNPDLEIVFPKLIEDNLSGLNEEFFDAAKEAVNIAIREMSKHKHSNLRSFICALAVYKKVCPCIPKDVNEENLVHKIAKESFIYSIRSTVKYKNGSYVENERSFEDVFGRDGNSTSAYFKFIDEMVSSSVYDSKSISSNLQGYKSYLVAQKSDSFIQLSQWFLYKEEAVVESYQNVFAELKEKRLDASLYWELLVAVLVLTEEVELEFENGYEKLLECMKQNIFEENYETNFGDFGIDNQLKPNQKEKLKQAAHSFKVVQSKKVSDSKASEFSNMLKKKGDFGKEFRDAANSCKGGPLFSFIEPDELLKALENAHPNDIRLTSIGIREFYDSLNATSFIKEDLKNLKKFNDLLKTDNLDSEDKIKMYFIKKLKRDVAGRVERFTKELNSAQ